MANLLELGGCRQASRDYNEQIAADPRVKIHEYAISWTRYHEYVDAAVYENYQYSHYNPGPESRVFLKKSLEHFISYDLLDIDSSDVFVDIAAHDAPVAQIFASLTGCSAYRQDLIFRPGVHGDRIGGDAAAMPVHDDFASKLALHSSFEHFEGDADSRFIRECERVLRPGGKACIVELFVAQQLSNMGDPLTWQDGIPEFDQDATVFLFKGWRNRFGRFYDWRALKARVLDHLRSLTFTLYDVANAKELHPGISIVRAAVLEQPH